MKTKPNYILLLSLALLIAGSSSAQAVVRVYRVSVAAKATYYQSNSFMRTGYLIFDTDNPGASQTIEVFPRTKTYQVNGPMAQVIAGGAITFFTLDRNNDAILDIEGATGAFQSGVIVQAVNYTGAIPRNGLRVGNVTLFQTARILKGKGSVYVQGADFYTRTDRFSIDALTGASPINTNAGVVLVTAQLAGRLFSQVP